MSTPSVSVAPVAQRGPHSRPPECREAPRACVPLEGPREAALALEELRHQQPRSQASAGCEGWPGTGVSRGLGRWQRGGQAGPLVGPGSPGKLWVGCHSPVTTRAPFL